MAFFENNMYNTRTTSSRPRANRRARGLPCRGRVRPRREMLSKVVDVVSNASALASLRYRFQCREWSIVTGLINFRMRWYDPETGRWLSKDPIDLNGGLNLYAFSLGNPVCFIDPDGEEIITVTVVVGGLAIAYGAYWFWDHFRKTRDRMKRAGSDDIRETMNGAVDCCDILFQHMGPHGVVPSSSSIITDPLDEMLTAPIRRRVIDKMRPWNDSLDKPDRSDMPYDGVIRDLED